jgi:transposase
MTPRPLFDLSGVEPANGDGSLVGPELGNAAATSLPRIGQRRLRCAVRDQIEFQQCSLNEPLPEDHEVRSVWEYVCGLDLSPLVDRIQSVEGGEGRAAADPKILMSLWMYATLQGVGSARELDRLGRQHIAYRWLLGCVSMNYHTLADFRVNHGEFLDSLLTQSVAALVAEGLVSLERVAQDGMKVRASAGAASFHREPTLDKALADAEAQVAALKAELDGHANASKTRREAARLRAAEDRAERIRRAREQHAEIAAKKGAEARASTTDPDARVMKMADGGFRPAFNVQLETATDSQVITGVDVTNSGGDQGKMGPMLDQHIERYSEPAKEQLIDGGFAKKEDIDKAEANGTTVYAPVMKSKDPERDCHTPRENDSPAVAAWRQRMATPEAQEIYKLRAATAECVNADARRCGLYQFRVRGLVKVKAVVLLYIIAHNFRRTVTLRAQATKKAK